MATSSKVQFKLATLRDKAAESIDLRIAQKRDELSNFHTDDNLREKIAKWRARQEERISEMFRRLGDIDNQELSKFRLDSIPEVGTWERDRLERDVIALQNTRSRIIAKSESLVPDADGNISLTKTQLKEFFEL